MIKRILANVEDIKMQIKKSSYNFFSVKSFFGFDDIMRFIKILYLFFSIVLNLLIVISLLKRKKNKNSIGLCLTGNILIINFIHTFSYILNWVTNIDNAYILNEKYKIGGLLIGNPKDNYSVCQIQGYMLLYSSLSQDLSIIIFFYIINMSKLPSKLNIYLLLFGLGHFLPFFYTTFCAIIDGLGLNDRYCYIKKFEYTNNDYEIYKYFRVLIIVTYTIRAINLAISIFLLLKINKYVKEHNLTKIYILKTYFLLILQVITIFIGFIYRISHLIANDNNKAFSNAYLCVNTIDGILFPLYYSISNGIYTNLFCKNLDNESVNSLLSEDKGNNPILNTTGSSSSLSVHSNNGDKTFAMVDVKDDNNFDLSYSNLN